MLLRAIHRMASFNAGLQSQWFEPYPLRVEARTLRLEKVVIATAWRLDHVLFWTSAFIKLHWRMTES